MATVAIAAGSAAAAFAAGCVAGRASKVVDAKPASGMMRQTSPEGNSDAIVVVDPFSTGARLAFEAQKRGYRLIRVLSSDFPDKFLTMVPEDCKSLEYVATIIFKPEDPAATVKEIMALPCHITSWQIGCESGVECYDALTAVAPGFPCNGMDSSAARRDKYLMGEKVRNAGLRAVKQRECRAWAPEALDFIRDDLKVPDKVENGRWCVLKPTKSAGSDGVYIAKSIAEAEDYFDRIIGAANIFGESNQTVLVQEFMKGKEYVVDSVTVEGSHKCVAIWEYDKRPVNGAPFVYYGMKLYQSNDGRREEQLVKYINGVLDCLDIGHGPTHGEVMWLDGDDEPCLVEVGARPHGGEGTFMELTEPVLGYSQVTALLDIFDRNNKYRRLPDRPKRFPGGAMEVMLVSKEHGTVAAYPELNAVRRLRSFKSVEMKVPVGGQLEPTVDFVTTPGTISLAHQDTAVVESDFQKILKLQEDGKFYLLVAAGAQKFNFRSL